ncbi:TRAP transporter small permease subunit [Silicimonas sp. MF1-12-2]|jgi:TRAP-type C4-dicarboxylate transport system permease small subunit|uniref:TRAP transporter small permease subunit n=1 Tax=Silicimonas sp. MF1-12-2 TaxID=3384793 RepID=UPI0039B6E572
MGSALTAVSRLVDGIAIFANAIGTLVVLALVGVVNFDAIARSLFNAPFLGAVEVVQFSMVLIVFLQLPDVCRVNRLTSSDGFLTILGGRRPRTANALRHAINFVSAVFMALIAIAIWPEFLKMFETQDYFGVPGVFTAPWWPIKLAIFAGAALCAVIFFLKVLKSHEDVPPVRLPEGDDA